MRDSPKPRRKEPVPSTPALADGAPARMARRERLRALRAHAKRAAVVSAGVFVVAAGVSLYLSQVGFATCSHGNDRICTRTWVYPLTFVPKRQVTTWQGVVVERSEWYPNGVLWITGAYVDGEKHGAWRELWPDGTPRFEGVYERGKLVGTETWWYPNGNVEWRVTRKAGERHGPEVWFWPDGKKRREGRYLEGKKHGVFTVYGQDGRVAFQVRYAQGVRVDGGAFLDE